jgi:hypothetical protein
MRCYVQIVYMWCCMVYFSIFTWYTHILWCFLWCSCSIHVVFHDFLCHIYVMFIWYICDVLWYILWCLCSIHVMFTSIQRSSMMHFVIHVVYMWYSIIFFIFAWYKCVVLRCTFWYSILFLLFSYLLFLFFLYSMVHGIHVIFMTYTRDVLWCILWLSLSIHTVTETYVILYFQVDQIVSMWYYFKFLSFMWFFYFCFPLCFVLSFIIFSIHVMLFII